MTSARRRAVAALLLALVTVLSCGAASASQGTTFTLVPTQTPLAAPHVGDLSGVSCVGTTWCWAIGDSFPGSFSGRSVAFAELWSAGHWTIPKGDEWNDRQLLKSVSCVSRKFCAIVGHPSFTWNGRTWSKVTPPTPSGQVAALTSVSCVSASDCVAVGSMERPLDLPPTLPSTSTIIERWNGRKWSLMKSPNEGVYGDYLQAVSCVTAQFCAAFGRYDLAPSVSLDGENPTETLVEVWTGHAWTIQTSPNLEEPVTFPLGISCSSSVSCVAVGGAVSVGSNVVPLALRFNGENWTLLSPPDYPNDIEELWGVACNATACFAVGGLDGGTGIGGTLALELVGNTWTRVPTQDVSNFGQDQLSSISCPQRVSCFAVGYSQSRNGERQAGLAERNF
jgi:hypothetical protein